MPGFSDDAVVSTLSAGAGTAVTGIGKDGFGVHGLSAGTGVVGESETWIGVFGLSKHPTGGIGVSGEAAGTGVAGKSTGWHGVHGETTAPAAGAVWGEHKAGGRGVVGVGDIGIFGQGRIAGHFEGDVEVTGDLRLTNADCAENFDVADDEAAEPGTVMVVGDDGDLVASQRAYDRRVAGVISGAGDYKPGIVLDSVPSERKRAPIALLGKTFCKVDAAYGPIEIGDLLVASDTPGRAMRVTDPARALGAVIGKALRPHQAGEGMIPILIALQ